MRSYAWIMAFQQHYLRLVPGLRFRWHPIGVVEQDTRGIGILGKLLFSSNWGWKCRGVLVKSKMKIEVRNEVCPPPRGLTLGRDPAGYPGGRYPGKTLVLEKLRVKVQGGGSWWSPKWRLRFETKFDPPSGCLSQRLKIGTRPCCGDRYCCPIYPPGGRYSGKTLILEIPGGKCVRMRG